MAGLACLRNVRRLMSHAMLVPVVACRLNPRAPAATALNLCRAVGTSQNSKATTAVSKTECSTEIDGKPKNWVSYGFLTVDEKLDRHFMHVTFFVSVTLVLVGISFILIYYPDFRLRDWSHREAFLELRRRESLGLPAIDCNLVDPAKVHLPTDEELGDTEIII